MIDTISIALPVCIRAVPAKTNTKSGYAIAAANEEFFVKTLQLKPDQIQLFLDYCLILLFFHNF